MGQFAGTRQPISRTAGTCGVEVSCRTNGPVWAAISRASKALTGRNDSTTIGPPSAGCNHGA